MILKRKILFAALIAAVATIPLKNQWNSIATILFVLTCFCQHPLSVSITKIKESKLWVIPLVYFVWLAFSHFWDVSGGYRLRDIERYLILFFAPPAMAVAPEEMKTFIKKACFVFIGVTIAVCLVSLVKSYNEYQATHDYRVFYYQYLAEQTGLNAIFLSNYCLASISWLLYYGFLGKRHSKRIYALICACIAFLFVVIFLLSSKLLIFLTLVVMVIFILILGYTKGFLMRAVLITSVVLAVGLVAVDKLSYLKWRIESTELKMYTGQEDNQNGIAIRLYMWKAVSGLIKERPLLGYGIRGGRLETLAKYHKDGFEMGVLGDYHAHNQYLESWLMAGIPGLILLVSLMAIVLTRALQSKNFLLLLIVIHFMTQCVFESTFEVQHELVFYIFFIFLFYYHGPRIRNALL
ncbi:MAG TPA: O-antigen ligase family protein [Flavitalea sp.]|nr:O-antigen ligase family protein [Flavitalea sp.]